MHESPGTRGVARHCDAILLSRHATPQRKSLRVEVRPSRAAAHHSAHATATPPSDGGCAGVAWASPSSAMGEAVSTRARSRERAKKRNVTRLIATFHKSFAERHPPPPPTPPLESGRLEFIWRLVRRLLLRTPSGGGSPREGGGKQ